VPANGVKYLCVVQAVVRAPGRDASPTDPAIVDAVGYAVRVPVCRLPVGASTRASAPSTESTSSPSSPPPARRSRRGPAASRQRSTPRPRPHPRHLHVLQPGPQARGAGIACHCGHVTFHSAAREDQSIFSFFHFFFIYINRGS
jgi:hypothetical protein